MLGDKQPKGGHRVLFQNVPFRRLQPGKNFFKLPQRPNVSLRNLALRLGDQTAQV